MDKNRELRKTIVEMAYRSGEGHIPSAFSILEIVSVLYEHYLKFDPRNPEWEERDYFILSKGHGSLALYVILEKYGFITRNDLDLFCKPGGILGEHPHCKIVPGVEASTGSLGHGFPFAVGLALAQRLKNRNNKVFVLVGDGECHEGTIWEAAHVANNLDLGQLCVLVDWNDSAKELLPKDDLEAKWRAFGWSVQIVDGHSELELKKALNKIPFNLRGTPQIILAKTVKGKGVAMLEGHGKWHHRIPNKDEFQSIIAELS